MQASRTKGRMSHTAGKSIIKTQNPATYLTPKFLLEKVYQCFPVDLDPSSNSHLYPQVQAKHHYTEQEDGLSQHWSGTVFCNPPYHSVSKWAAKFLASYTIGYVYEGILLVASSTETKWYQALGRSEALICHLNQRLWFDQSPGVPCKERARFASVLFYLGPNPRRFRMIFDELGFIR